MMKTQTEEKLHCILGYLGQIASSGSRSLTPFFLTTVQNDNAYPQSWPLKKKV